MSFLNQYQRPEDLPEKIPVFPLSGALLLPGADLPLNIFEPRYLAMVNDAMSSHRLVGMIQPAFGHEAETKPPLTRVGCVGRIVNYAETADGRIVVTLTGICRFQLVKEVRTNKPYRLAQVNYHPYAVDLVADAGASSVDRPALLKAFRDFLTANNMKADWNEVDNAPTGILVNTLSLLAPYPPEEKQALLEAPDLKSRAEVLVALTEVALSKMGGAKPRLQ